MEPIHLCRETLPGRLNWAGKRVWWDEFRSTQNLNRKKIMTALLNKTAEKQRPWGNIDNKLSSI